MFPTARHGSDSRSSAAAGPRKAANIPATAGEHPQAISLRDHHPVRELPGFAEGWLTVQDESAMRVALSPRS